MKNSALIITLLLFACSGGKTGKVIYSDLRTENIKGDVLYMTTTSYKCDSTGRIGEMEDCCITLMEYNEDGNLVRQTSKDKTGKLTEEEATTIHANGLRTSVRTLRDGKQTRYIELFVNSKGRYYAGKVLDSANALRMYYEDLVMNEYGQPVSFTLYGKDSLIIMKEEAKYDGNKLLSYFQTDKDGKQTARFENRFNEKGELVESTSVQLTDKGEEKKVMKHTYDGYDAKGNWTQTTNWDANGKAKNIYRREFAYRQ